MLLKTIESGTLKLDGGAMFGVVPQTVWAKLNPPDSSNLCTWSMRTLLIDTGARKILIDTGIGQKQDDKFRRHFQPEGQASFFYHLHQAGYQPDEITDVFLTHLHFDHVGGALLRAENGTFLPAFPNARYWTNHAHLAWATHPNPREAASFLPENFLPLKALDRFAFIDASQPVAEWLPDISVRFVYGHTEAMMLPEIVWNGRKIIYCADLIPSSAHLGLPYVMAYDVRPLETMKEKERLLEEAIAEEAVLVFEHDPKVPAAIIGRNTSGKYALRAQGSLEDLLR